MGYWMIMATWRRMFLVAHVWLTAFTTLLAGLPHFRCQCLTEHSQPISLSIPFQVGKCCQAGSCCPSAPGGSAHSGGSPTASQAERPCCCCHATSEQNTDKRGRHSELKDLGCKRTLTDAAPALPASQQMTHAHWVVELLVSDLAPLSLDPSFQARYSISPWQSHSPPSPTDLVVTLQHFLI
jgi:hypothetical protein